MNTEITSMASGLPSLLGVCLIVSIFLTLRLIYLIVRIYRDRNLSNGIIINDQTPPKEILRFYVQFKEKCESRLTQIRILIYVSILTEIFVLLNILKNFSKYLSAYQFKKDFFDRAIGISIYKDVYATSIFLIFWMLVTVVYFYIKRKFFQFSFEADLTEEKQEGK